MWYIKAFIQLNCWESNFFNRLLWFSSLQQNIQIHIFVQGRGKETKLHSGGHSKADCHLGRRWHWCFCYCLVPGLTMTLGFQDRVNEVKVNIAFSTSYIDAVAWTGWGEKSEYSPQGDKRKTDASNYRLRGNRELYRSDIAVIIIKYVTSPYFFFPTIFFSNFLIHPAEVSIWFPASSFIIVNNAHQIKTGISEVVCNTFRCNAK